MFQIIPIPYHRELDGHFVVADENRQDFISKGKSQETVARISVWGAHRDLYS